MKSFSETHITEFLSKGEMKQSLYHFILHDYMFFKVIHIPVQYTYNENEIKEKIDIVQVTD